MKNYNYGKGTAYKTRASRYTVPVLCVLIAYLSFAGLPDTLASGYESYVAFEGGNEKFPLSEPGKAAPVCISSQDYAGVMRAGKDLVLDMKRVTARQHALAIDTLPKAEEIVLIGTVDKNPFINQLVQTGKIEVIDIAGKWETFLIQVVNRPLPHIDRALIIVGSDKRGTIYGIYDLSEKIGISPWYWWADVPVPQQSGLYINPGRYTQGEPAVKYRGIFINDEAPALSGWAHEKFGGFNHQFYAHVFELILRLKGNFLWPAMWGRAFYVDDPLNPQLADEYGIVIGTSHHEPMMRAHDEWRRFGSGPWNYERNEIKLRAFWKEGIVRMDDYESIVTLAMRGDGDKPMSEEANIALLEQIVNDQRAILDEVTGKEITDIPQVWALYKEVQEYYDKGMRVPDDVTLLLCDDNWGNIRMLPKLSDKPRPGGYGIYYHYDYVGGPRNYKWLNTNQIARVWEQMHLAYSYGVERIWIVNVGDIKPMEFPISFFLDYAWSPEKWPAERLPAFTKKWAQKQFGAAHAQAIADILTNYTRYNARRKPELLAPDTYSLHHYREAENIVTAYNSLAKKAEKIYSALPDAYRDAYYQLVLHPVLACSNLNELYVTVGKNRFYAQQGRAATNALAEKARKLFKRDAEITIYYNTEMVNGKWNHMMDQTHIGYTYWQQPEKNSMPEVKEIELPDTAAMGVAIEGSDSWWPLEKSTAQLPTFDPYHRPSYYIDIFNRGKTPFTYALQAVEPWIQIIPASDLSGNEIEIEQRLWISIDWQRIPHGFLRAPITITGPDQTVVVEVVAHNPESPARNKVNGFIESNGYVSIEAEHYTRAVSSSFIDWQHIPDFGRTFSGMTPIPVTAESQIPGDNGPRLEYTIHFFSKGDVSVKTLLSPTLNFHHNQGLRYAISFDDEQPQVINMHADYTFQDWEESVRNNIRVKISHHTIDEPGEHVLKFWMVDAGIVLQKLVIETGEVKPSYLGPPESFFRIPE